MSAIILQIINICVLGMGFYQFLREGYRFIKKAGSKFKTYLAIPQNLPPNIA